MHVYNEICIYMCMCVTMKYKSKNEKKKIVGSIHKYTTKTVYMHIYASVEYKTGDKKFLLQCNIYIRYIYFYRYIYYGEIYVHICVTGI